MCLCVFGERALVEPSLMFEVVVVDPRHAVYMHAKSLFGRENERVVFFLKPVNVSKV